MTDRRYNDDEVAAIFAKAAEDSQSAPLAASRSEGPTLAELQEIGREVGISPEAVVAAARSIAVEARTRPTRVLGLPLSVARTVELDRRMTDEEWERLVVELREVFHARGTMSSSGSLRQWTNGNLQALLEPTATGQRLRLRTMNGAARGTLVTGLAFVGMALGVGIAGAIAGHLGSSMPGVAMFSLIGAGLVASGALRLPTWARLRGQQMDTIANGLAAGADRVQAPVDDRRAIDLGG